MRYKSQLLVIQQFSKFYETEFLIYKYGVKQFTSGAVEFVTGNSMPPGSVVVSTSMSLSLSGSSVISFRSVVIFERAVFKMIMRRKNRNANLNIMTAKVNLF